MPKTRLFNYKPFKIKFRFVILCENILASKAFNSIEAFSKDFLPKLLLIRSEKVANIRVLLARLISTHILSIEYFSNGSCPLAGDLEMTIQYLRNDQDNDVKSYFYWSNNANEKAMLPPYDELFRNKINENVNSANAELNLETKNSNFIYNCSELEKIDIINSTSSASTSVSTMSEMTSSNENTPNFTSVSNIKGRKVVYGASKNQEDDDEDEVENMEEEDDDDEDEIIDKTKINQLKIVNLENDLDNEPSN